jgi:hypothetical protein
MTDFVMNTRVGPVVRRGDDDDDVTFLGAFRAACADAEEYIDGHIAPLRAAATKFYRGEPFGNEETGRSQVVTTDVRDAVLAILPSLMRIFVSGENVVEFVPTSGKTIEIADQQTAYVNYVFMQDNPGFLTLYSAFKDALVRKTGVIKWRYAKDTTVTETSFTGLPAEQITVLQQDKTVRILEIEEGEEMVVERPPVLDPQTGQQLPQEPLRFETFDVRIRREVPRNRMVVECLPPEEYLINRDARDANSEYGWTFQAHRSYKTVSELVALGYNEEEILEHAGGGDTFTMNYEAQSRNPAVASFASFDTPDDSMRRVLYIEAYMRVDKDGDGIAELRKICAIGDAYHVLHDEIVEDAPFAVFCPDPEPHMVIGGSVADQTMDMQFINSNILRNLLDSLAGSIHPRTVVVEGQVNLDDALNTEQGAIIRARNINAVNELVKPFVGQQALPVMAWLDQIKSKRTGITDASQGLDPSMLQSATHAAVSATVTGAQERIELYARIFAETGMKRLFRGIAKSLRENQDAPRVLKLNGSWSEVDPRNWEGELEVTPNVAIGKGTDQDKIQFLGIVLQKQELAIQTLGPANPFAGLDKYRNTLAQIMTLAGFKDANRYFGQITPEYLQQLQEAASKQPPDPRMLLVQIEAQKSQQQHELKVAEFIQQRQNDFQTQSFQREKLHMDTLVKMTQIEAQHGRELNLGIIDRMMQKESEEAARHTAHMQEMHRMLLGHEQAIHATETRADVDHTNNLMKNEVAHRQADIAERAAQAKAAAGGSNPGV